MRARELECGSKRRDVMGGKEEKEGRGRLSLQA